MLVMFDAINQAGQERKFTLGDLSSGYVVKEVTGLDPVKATLVSTSFAQQDGSQYQSSRRESRDIQIRIGMDMRYGRSVQDLRRDLYQWFMPKRPINLRFYTTNTPVLHISGRVESLETAIFSREPEVVVTITCFDPDFYDPTEVIISGLSTATTSEFVVDYAGSIETGIVFTFKPNRSIDAFAIYHRSEVSQTSSFSFSEDLVAGDILTVVTVSGQKQVLLTSGSQSTSLLRGVSAFSNWITLTPGLNYLRVYATGASIPYDLKYTTKYGAL